ncbi:MAG TPA: hypothetical protein IGS53_21990 [Leptolyngbyaceae cyanobacterium M33_DOE_097]|uniref:Uncharacterized protein n=1 Tax=Oscillatoriales cyanobacterium SpSt-418 TaxID=2282169 RepID=A0A7C3PHJ3_9CYAN|nr:hypothetical protein [Leptolyngbyaceae cyanobacterium M33_DOE_097]
MFQNSLRFLPGLRIQNTLKLAAIALALVRLETFARKGFETMVDDTAPIFWFFLLLRTVLLIVLQMQEPCQPLPFQVPLYPLTSILFCTICGYLLYSSLVYTGIGAIAGVMLVLFRIPVVRRNS